ncbi:hypothetical protein [Paludibacterium denitrificans]|nr:hypothetical protein [Paludibacterium denitrificans]
MRPGVASSPQMALQVGRKSGVATASQDVLAINDGESDYVDLILC